jgi:short-subunit dehydrogenase
MTRFNKDLLFGATGGVGIEIARMLTSKKNAEKILLFSNQNKSNLHGNDIINIKLDLYSKNAVENYLPFLKGINRLFLAHGIRIPNTLDENDLIKMMSINYVATIKLIDNFLNNASAGSLIFVISSIASKLPSYKELGYASSKAALSVAIEAMQTKATKHGIVLIDLKLGATRTTMNTTREDYNNLIAPDELADVINQISSISFSTLRIPQLEIIRSRYKNE